MKSCSQNVTTNQQTNSYRPDALPVAQTTVSKHWRTLWQVLVLLSSIRSWESLWKILVWSRYWRLSIAVSSLSRLTLHSQCLTDFKTHWIPLSFALDRALYRRPQLNHNTKIRIKLMLGLSYVGNWVLSRVLDRSAVKQLASDWTLCWTPASLYSQIKLSIKSNISQLLGIMLCLIWKKKVTHCTDKYKNKMQFYKLPTPITLLVTSIIGFSRHVHTCAALMMCSSFRGCSSIFAARHTQASAICCSHTQAIEWLRERTEHLNICLFFCPSLNGVLFPMFCLLVEGECQILVFKYY